MLSHLVLKKKLVKLIFMIFYYQMSITPNFYKAIVCLNMKRKKLNKINFLKSYFVTAFLFVRILRFRLKWAIISLRLCLLIISVSWTGLNTFYSFVRIILNNRFFCGIFFNKFSSISRFVYRWNFKRFIIFL